MNVVSAPTRPPKLTGLINELLTVLLPCLSNQPAPGRVPYLLHPILFPTEPVSHDDDNQRLGRASKALRRSMHSHLARCTSPTCSLTVEL